MTSDAVIDVNLMTDLARLQHGARPSITNYNRLRVSSNLTKSEVAWEANFVSQSFASCETQTASNNY